MGHENCSDIENRPGCIQSTLLILGDKWTALIIRDLVEADRTFSELERGMEGMSPRTLSQRLEKLEEDGIISRHLYCPHPPRYRYALTEKGSSLEGVLRQMAAWGEKYA